MRRPGFTLLEVLAAVAVLALVYSVLAGTAMQGLANEGEAHRRLRATLLADLQLSEIEAGLAATAPALGVTEAEQDDYTISIEVRPFDLGAFAHESQQEATEQRPAPQADPGAAGAGPPFQLLTAAPGAPSPLLEIIVHVGWVEGVFEREVTRTTFSADPVAVQQAVAALPGAGGTDAAGEDAAADDAARDPGELTPPPDDAEAELEE